MIAILTHTEDITKFLSQVGIARHEVVLNPERLNDPKFSVVVEVGGDCVRDTHCYVQRSACGPIRIQCLAPESCRAEPENKVWILCALEKARRIDKGEYQPPKTEFMIRPQMAEVERFLASIPSDARISFDLECERDNHEITVFGIAFRDKDTIKSISIPLVAENQPYWTESEEAKIWKLVAQLLANAQPKVMQNFIFDTMMLSKDGIQTNGPIFCTMTAAHWIQPELPKSLADLGRLYLMVDVWKGQQNWTSNETLWRYNAKDAAYTLLILEQQLEAMRETNREEFYVKQLTPLATEVLRVCERGWTLDEAALEKLNADLSAEVARLRSSLQAVANDLIPPKITYKLVRSARTGDDDYFRGKGDPIVCETRETKKGTTFKKLAFSEYEKAPLDWTGPVFTRHIERHEFNPASPLDVKDVLSALGIKVPSRKGKETTNELALLKLQDKKHSPFIADLLEFRGAAKMLSTYGNVARDSDGQVRFSITIPGTVEGRFSSKQTPWETGCNSQNIPKSFRHVVIPSKPGWRMVNMDFRQADPHMVAWLAQEDTMLQILNDPKGDLHAHTASGIFGYDITAKEGYDKNSSRERKLGKACNNGLNYGMQPPRFIETCRKQGLVLTPDEALKAYSGYFRLYPGIRAWQDSIRQQLTRTRTLSTPFGRTRYFYGYLNDKTFNEAFAYIPPTTVSDALNAGWLRMAQSKGSLQFEVLAQVHDSLVLQCPAEEVDETIELMVKCFKEVRFDVGRYKDCNFPVDVETGVSWGNLENWRGK